MNASRTAMQNASAPSPERMAQHKAELEEQGYTLVSGALPPERFDELLATTRQIAADEVANGTDYVYEDGSNQRIWVLLNKGPVFEELVQNEVVLELIG